MKLILLSDLHGTWKRPEARLDKNYGQVFFNKLQFVFDYAEEHEIDTILQAGDFCNRPREWNFMEAAADFLTMNRITAKVYSVFGQHDIYFRSREASCTLSVLESMRSIRLLGKTPAEFMDQDGVVKVYGCSFGDKVPEPEDDVTNILVVHAPIASVPAEFPHMSVMSASEFLDIYRSYDLILCGDIHRAFHIEVKNPKRIIINTGPMMRNTAEKYFFRHLPLFKIYDTDTKEVETIYLPVKPANKVLTRDHRDREAEIENMMTEFITSVKESVREERLDVITAIHKFIDAQSAISENVKSILARVINE